MLPMFRDISHFFCLILTFFSHKKSGFLACSSFTCTIGIVMQLDYRAIPILGILLKRLLVDAPVEQPPSAAPCKAPTAQ